jgi:hypothetical protein
MVFSEIKAGLGNQLFQYAAGRALAERLGTQLRLEAGSYRTDPIRSSALQFFRIQGTFCTRLEHAVLHRWERPPYGKIVGLWQKWIPGGTLTVLNDPENGFDERILTVSGHVFLKGFWQSERYFSAMGDQLREELTLRTEPDALNQTVLDEIGRTESVALHVRRGDYAADPKFTAAFGLCDLDYYQRAVELLQSKIPDLHFYIFSDDPIWTRDNLKLSAPSTYLTHNIGKADHEDLRLMSHCKHFIIANSSFSWWGAWLGKNREKWVIAPKRWFATYGVPHLAPSDWIRL